MWSRKSNDNGASWLPNDTLSDVVSPLPAQPDPNIVSVYVGDYDYGSALLTKHVTSWADGRVTINSASQQDAFTDRELVGFAVTTDPACGSVVMTQPTDFIIDVRRFRGLLRRAISQLTELRRTFAFRTVIHYNLPFNPRL